MPLPSLLLQGVDLQRFEMRPGREDRSYLMGQWQPTGWYHYYLVAWLVKTPVPAIGLVALAAWRCGWLAWVSLRRPCGDPRARVQCREFWLEQFLLVAAVVLIVGYVSSHTVFNRHLRYILPAYPFAMVWGSQVAQFKLRRLPSASICGIVPRSRSISRWVQCLVMLQALTFVWHGPHWLSYFNELAGGPKRGGQWVLDSNIDWGQDYFYLRDRLADQSQGDQSQDMKPQLLWFGLCDPREFGVEYQAPVDGWQPGDGIEKLLNAPGRPFSVPTAFMVIKCTL